MSILSSSRLFALTALLFCSAPSLAAAASCPTTEALLATAYDSPAQANFGIHCLGFNLVEQRDRRAVFAVVYGVILEAIDRAVRQNVFEDPKWIEELSLNFVNLYREAFLNFENREFQKVPRAWLIAFRADGHADISVLQNVWLGMNAHISRDLPFALAMTQPRESFRHQEDHHRVEQVLGAAIPEIRRRLALIFAAGLDEPGLTSRYFVAQAISKLRSLRADAWTASLRLISSSAPSVAVDIELRALRSAQSYLYPNIPLEVLLVVKLMEHLKPEWRDRGAFHRGE